MAVISFKCPNCDGELIFDPSTKKYKCEYCDSLFSQEELDSMQPAAAENQAEETPQHKEAEQSEQEDGFAEGQEAVEYTCPSCGAQIVTDETTAATFCYYCHNPVVLSGRLEGKLLPNRIIPFAVTREAAEKGFKDYIAKKKFVPKAFYNKKQIESMTGVYFPYWTYEVKLAGKMQGEARNIRVWRTGDVEYTQTKHYRVAREGKLHLSNLTENALKKANAKLANGMMPYKFEEMESFKMSYLSGFQAECRDMEQTEVENKMQCEMRDCAQKLLRETISGYNSVTIQNVNFVPEKEDFSYVLFPVWTLTYKAGNGKIYYYSMNGQTGKVCGELPVDYKKVTFVSALVTAIVLTVGLIAGYIL